MLRYIQLSMYSWVRRQILSDAPLPPPHFASIFEKIEQQLWVIPTLPPEFCSPTLLGKVPALANGTAASQRGIQTTAPANHLDALVPINKSFDPAAFIRNHGPPPMNDKGGPMCLLYHVWGQCVQDCARGSMQSEKSDHRRHSKSETGRLVAYLSKGK